MGNDQPGGASRIRLNCTRYASFVLAALLFAAFAAGLSGSSAAMFSPETTAAVESNPETGDHNRSDVPDSQQSTPPAAKTDMEEVSASPTPLTALNPEYASCGSMTIEGMKGSDYDQAMSAEWTQVDTPGEPVPYDIDISSLMDYQAIEKYILNLGRYNGVDIYIIGQSEQGRNIYMVKLNLSGSAEGDTPLIMLTGSVHAREFAGADYMVKFLNDTLQKAQADAYTLALLQSVTVAAVPLVNSDGREFIIAGGDPDRKSNANGVDLNRAMPSANAGQLDAGAKLVENFSDVPGMDFFAGYRLGTESETQAMIKWMNVYVPQAAAYIDLHQQGGVTFYNKEFTSGANEEACLKFAEKIDRLLKHGYEPWEEHKGYALDGDGGTMTDYARSLAEGFRYSYRLGRMALMMDGVETPLICFKDIDNCPEYYKPLNADLLCISIEIGRKPAYLGAGEDALEKRAVEYKKYGWKNFLTGTIETILGNKKVKEIKSAT